MPVVVPATTAVKFEYAAARVAWFKAGQASWMKARVRNYARPCAHGSPDDLAEAARILAEVQDLLRSPQRLGC